MKNINSKKHLIFTDIILIDIIDYSKLNNMQQFDVVDLMTKFFKRAINLMLSKSKIPNSEAILGFIATGDGFFVILAPRLKGYGVIFALSLKNISNSIHKKINYFKGIKIAVHTGYLMPFSDILNHQNFIGDGLNNCARYLEFKNPNIYDYFPTGYIIISRDASKYFMNFLSENKKISDLINDLGFHTSKEIMFEDKHKHKHYGYYIWTDKEVIITPP